MQSLKEQYNLHYETSDFKSSLTSWYNEVIDKTYDLLSVEDVSKLIRQDIIKKIALEKAIELFDENPYAGDYYDGALLKTLATIELKYLANLDEKYLVILTNKIDELKQGKTNFKWLSLEDETKYLENIKLLEKKLSKREEFLRESFGF
jgi:hypothetical protein